MTSAQPTARDDAIRLLARREYSRQELVERLKVRGHGSGIISDTLSDLETQGLQSDERFAESFLRGRVQRGQGIVKMLADISLRGIDRSMASQVLAQIERDLGIDWEEQAREVLQRRFGEEDFATLPVKEKGRRERFLASRGFTFEQVKKALNRRD